MKCDKLNVFGLREYNRQDFFDEPTDDIRFADRFYIMTEADAVLKGQQELIAEKDREIALLKERICNGDVSRLTWIDDCIAKDKEIAELKAKLMPCLNGDCILTCEVVEKYGKENEELKQKLENVQASMYADVVDANMEIRRLKRSLFLMGARLGKMGYLAFHNIQAKLFYLVDEEGRRRANIKKDQWKNVERKCRAKAEEYK